MKYRELSENGSILYRETYESSRTEAHIPISTVIFSRWTLKRSEVVSGSAQGELHHTPLPNIVPTSRLWKNGNKRSQVWGDFGSFELVIALDGNGVVH